MLLSTNQLLEKYMANTSLKSKKAVQYYLNSMQYCQI